MKKAKFTKLLAMLLLGAFALSGCALPFNLPVPKIVPPEEKPLAPAPVPVEIKKALEEQSKIKKFKDYDELAAFLSEAPSNSYANGMGFGGGVRTLTAQSGMGAIKKEMAVDSAVPAPTAAPAAQTTSIGLEDDSSAGASDFSKTNVQVEGVDEADIIKSDGKYIYALAHNSVFIINAYPAESAEILSKIQFKSRPVDMYIDGDRLVVFGSDDLVYKTEAYSRFRRQNPYSFFKIFDISDRKNPKQIRDLDFEGNYQDSRLIGDYVYFITNNYGYYYVAGEPVVPRLLEDGVAMADKCAAGVKCFAPSVYYFDLPYSSYNFTTVTAVNIKDTGKPVSGEVYILSGGQNVYVSQSNLYITYTKYVSEYQLELEVMQELISPRLSSGDREKISEIKATKNYILSEDEKAQKIGAIIERYASSLKAEEQKKLEEDLKAAMKKKYEDLAAELEKTVIHKISLSGDKVEYKASGEVTGYVLNQFSMDEQNGYFRIATTRSRAWLPYYLQDDSVSTSVSGSSGGSTGAEPAVMNSVAPADVPMPIRKNTSNFNSYSNLYVLDGELKTVGKIEKLAPGEQIYSVRFMQNRAYLVTFVQTDPLFVIDLSVPTNPRVLGELKMPGFSNYLHPYGDKMLIGIGKDAVASEGGGARTKGLKFSLFDVSNISAPKEIDSYVMGDAGSDSIALHDHKAFLFSAEKNLLVVPVTLTEDKTGRGWGDMVFSGAAVFKINEKGFELKGKIDHSNGGKQAANDCWWGYCYYDNNVLRSLYIGDSLYTFSNQLLKANKLSDLAEIKAVQLVKEKIEDVEIIN